MRPYRSDARLLVSERAERDHLLRVRGTNTMRHRLSNSLLVVLAGSYVIFWSHRASGEESEPRNWEEAVTAPVKSSGRSLADQLAGTLDQNAPRGVLAVVGEYRGGKRFAIADADLSPDGRRIVLAGEDSHLYVWNLASQQRVATWSSDRPPEQVLYSPDGRYLAVVSGSGKSWLTVRDAQSGEILWKRPRSPKPDSWPAQNFESVDFSPDGTYLASSSSGGMARVWKTADGSIAKRIPGAGRGGLAFSPDGQTLAIAGGWRALPRQNSDGGSIIGSAPDNRVALQARLVDWNQPEPRFTYVPAPGGRFADFHPDGDRVIFDGFVNVRVPPRRGRRRAFFFRDVTDEGDMRIVDVPSAESLPGTEPELVRAQLSGDGRWLAAEFRDSERSKAALVVYGLGATMVSVREVKTIEAPRGCEFTGMMFADSGDRLVTALGRMDRSFPGCANLVRVRRTDDWKVIEEFRATPRPIPADGVRFSEDGRLLEVVREDGMVDLYNLSDRDRWTELERIVETGRASPLIHFPGKQSLADGHITALPRRGHPQLPRQWKLVDAASGRPFEFGRLQAAGAGAPVAVSE
ncbi:MAG: WD40 repeat domain-containing protein, partial [Bradymonadaceae bacterium]